jgi:mono/diheme cytochrome c family protein
MCLQADAMRIIKVRGRAHVFVLSMFGLLCALGSTCFAAEPPALPVEAAHDMEADAMWSNHIEPILSKNCFRCHGGEKQKGGLDLRAVDSIIVGGTDGSAVIPTQPNSSPLFQRIQPDSDEHMPADKGQLSPEEIAYVKQWITALPISGHPAPGSSKVNWTQPAPSLIELATRADWSPPEGMTQTQVIDDLIEAKWRTENVSGAGLCDDATFVRRIYLDLVGRIPTVAEDDEFVRSTDAQKRAALVDRLLDGKEYPRRMAELLDVVLLERKGKAAEAERKSHGWFAYLEHAFATNRRWNQIVEDLIVARPSSPDDNGAVWFLYEKKNNYQQMAEAVAPVAFGVSIGCAQCHNHPLAHEIKQQNYWGLVAAFNRTTNADTSQGPAMSESAVGGFVNFTNLKKESQPAVIALLNDKTIDELRPVDGEKEADSDDKYLVPPAKDSDGNKGSEGDKGNAKGRDRQRRSLRQAAIPKFSRRQVVADAITHDNPLLARAFVNRIWAMLLGRGIVSPVDQIDSRHLPSHPELLGWLEHDFEQNGYDIKQLIRTIVLSRTYQLKAPGAAKPAAPELFACSLERPLSAEVLYRSLLTATGNSASDTDDLRRALIAAFPSLFEVEYNPSLQQAAFLTNSPLVDQLLKPSGKNLTSRLLELSANEDRVRDVFQTVLGRWPDDEERVQSLAYLNQRSEHSEAALRQLEWALLTSSEFLMNH